MIVQFVTISMLLIAIVVLLAYNIHFVKDKERTVQVGDGPQLDAFSRLRTSNVTTAFNSKLVGNDHSLYWDDQQVSGSGTSSVYNIHRSSMILSVSDNTAGQQVRQSKIWHLYQPGKSQIILLTGILGKQGKGVTARLGLFQQDDGLFFENKDGVVSVCIRSSVTGEPVDEAIPQHEWNVDTLDGKGKSGILIDWSKTQIFVIDFQWLGGGRVRFGFDMGANTIYCHQVHNSNIRDSAYMRNPSLPVRYEISNDGTGQASSLEAICSSVMSEGGSKFTGSGHALSRMGTSLTTNNDSSYYPLIAIRLKPDTLHGQVSIYETSVMCTSTATYEVILCLNPTISGTDLAYLPVDNSCLEADTTTTNATTLSHLGTVLYSKVTSDSVISDTASSFKGHRGVRLGSSIDKTPDVLVLAVSRIVGTTETFYATMNIEEDF